MDLLCVVVFPQMTLLFLYYETSYYCTYIMTTYPRMGKAALGD